MRPYPRAHVHGMVTLFSAVCAGIFVLTWLHQQATAAEAIVFGLVLFAGFLGAGIFSVEVTVFQPKSPSDQASESESSSSIVHPQS